MEGVIAPSLRCAGRLRGPRRRESSTAAHAAHATAMHPLPSVKELIDNVPFTGVLLDQFGVLHDGRKPYPGALEAVRSLHAAGKRIAIVSNSSRRAQGALGKIAKMGFREEWFAGVVTSGELTHRALAERRSSGVPLWQALGDRCIWCTWSGRGGVSLDGTGVTATLDPRRADFVLAQGTEALGSTEEGPETREASMEELLSVLRTCAAAKLPMVVANPDIVTVDASMLVPMPGMLAREYKRMGGGPVVLMGKPAPVIYEHALGQILDLQPSECIAIGDSLEHDIAGAQAAGVDSLFIAGGIHGRDVALEGPEWELDASALERLIEQEGHAPPTYVMPFFR